ncbi:MAG: TetR/AcrR family transcriptional regulator C-terminal domain-containing protein [Culicoidibacterales bacterium]
MKTRRNVTSEFLKECVADSLLQLLEVKKIEEITITEITERANVGRATYYRNFQSKEMVIVFKLRYVLEQWSNEQIEIFHQIEPTYEMALAFMNFFYTNRILLISLYKNHLLYLLIPAFYELAEEKMTKEDKPLHPFVQAFHTFGIFGIIYEWVRNGMETSPEVVTEIMFNEIFRKQPKKPRLFKEW